MHAIFDLVGHGNLIVRLSMLGLMIHILSRRMESPSSLDLLILERKQKNHFLSRSEFIIYSWNTRSGWCICLGCGRVKSGRTLCPTTSDSYTWRVYWRGSWRITTQPTSYEEHSTLHRFCTRCYTTPIKQSLLIYYIAAFFLKIVGLYVANILLPTLYVY